MNAGHFGVAAAAKSYAPGVPLWLLMLGTKWLGVLFLPCVALEIERAEPMTGAQAEAYGDLAISADNTHSFVGATVLSIVLARVVVIAHSEKSADVAGLVAVSHWLFDLLVHRGDLPVLLGAAGGLPRLGFGLWRFHTALASIQFCFVAGGAYLYWRAAQKGSGAAAKRRRRANICNDTVFIAGELTLVPNVLEYWHRLCIRRLPCCKARLWRAPGFLATCWRGRRESSHVVRGSTSGAWGGAKPARR